MHYFSNLFLIKNSTCFGQIYCPASGVSTLYAATRICHASYVDSPAYLILLDFITRTILSEEYKSFSSSYAISSIPPLPRPS